MSKYIIWDKTSDVITPIGEVFTAEQWKDRYPMARSSSIDLVVAGDSAINGAFCQEYTSFISVYEKSGCDFTGCTTKQEHLDRIEQFEKDRETESANYVSPEERTAAALEAQVLIALDNETNE
jgi:hypothetical protein